MYGLPLDPGMRGVFDFRAWVDVEPTKIGPFVVSVAPGRHPVEAYAVRLDHDGRSLVYTGDTGPNPELAELAVGADLLLGEATYLTVRDNPPDLHLTGRQAGETRSRPVRDGWCDPRPPVVRRAADARRRPRRLPRPAGAGQARRGVRHLRPEAGRHPIGHPGDAEARASRPAMTVGPGR